jgi:hypothetical protein
MEFAPKMNLDKRKSKGKKSKKKAARRRVSRKDSWGDVSANNTNNDDMKSTYSMVSHDEKSNAVGSHQNSEEL